LVPYHALPRLHELIKDDCPPPYRSIAQAWREILPAVLRQTKDPDYHVPPPPPPPPTPPLPRPGPPPPPPPAPTRAAPPRACRSTAPADAQGWVDAGAASDLRRAEARRFDHDRKTYALVRTDSGALYATDG